jgi:hypothetical protein
VYVIDIYRTPIERKFSEFFEKISPYHFNNSEENINKYSVKRVTDRFNKVFPYLGLGDHFIDKYNIPSKIGIHENVGNNINIESLVHLNNEFNNFINNPIDFNSYDYEKYVAMAAGCEEEGLTGLSSYASPIVSYPSLEDIRIKNIKDIILDEKYSTYKKRYNIFGHQPSGLLPYMNKVTKEDIFSYHIDLDISKAENIGGISNKISYVYLEITENEDLLKGKTESGLPYKIVTKIDNNLIDSGQSEEGTNITIEYAIPLDNYYDNRIEANYNEKPGLIFSIDNSINHYGMFGYQLVKYTKQEGGSGKNKKKIYIKSDKRFMNGKRKMIIYLGKRGGEYVKVKGEYISIIKFIRKINKNK